MPRLVTGERDPVDILGIPVDPLTSVELLERVVRAVEVADRARLFFCLNVNYANLAQSDAALLDAFRQADTVYADSMGILIGARILGRRLPAKLTTTDFVEPLAAVAARRGFSVFFLGGAPGRAEEAAARLAARHPGLRVCGTHDGFFTPSDSTEVVKAIWGARPDILLVGLGAGLQECWLTRHRSDLPPCAALTCGALFDFVSGWVRRAPPLLTDHGLEWVWRLALEPRRLWRRYVLGNPRFLASVLRSRRRHRRA